ncbi:DNA repair protein RecN [Paenibacillus sp. HB172176]|uniref:DNA repair protein RecN n=1 Tax=Paenibacillus sp. HB172176 TaxID=2493690 RepID=UPI00143AFD7E|nr:DNA repair protein RecN [Paenibacillus sp. HB172176]
MLRELSIRNLAVIEQVNVLFHNGFHVLTGETGAGKSILIDALSLVVGGRGSADMVRYHCDKAEIEAMFDLGAVHPVWAILDSLGVAYSAEDMLIIRRELTSGGKSSSRVNGQLVTLTMLREIGETLVNIHGQHEHQSLLRTDRHLEWLDLFGGKALLEKRVLYRQAYTKLTGVRNELRSMEESTRQNEQMLDLYRFQIEEISTAELKEDEDEQLTEQKRILMYAEKRMDAAAEAHASLSGGKGLDVMNRAITKLNDIITYDSAVLGPIIEQLQSAYYQAEDAVFQLRDYRDGIESNPEELAIVEDRLDTIHGLKRKYGETIPDILAYLEEITLERDKIENRDCMLEELQQQEIKLREQALELAGQLSKLRRAAAERLSGHIKEELRQLQMNAEFEVGFMQGSSEENPERKLHANGLDEAVFMLTTNPGEPMKPLNKIASGGEMSRIMLALKSIFAEIDQVPVLVFDEVDTGVSGRAAQAIAEKMSALALRCQVFSITHLPQVACMADHHYEIRKAVKAERTSTSVSELHAAQRIDELARMLGGVEITEKTRHHAQEMLDLALELKGA